jgi:hypothetical protein
VSSSLGIVGLVVSWWLVFLVTKCLGGVGLGLVQWRRDEKKRTTRPKRGKGLKREGRGWAGRLHGEREQECGQQK